MLGKIFSYNSASEQCTLIMKELSSKLRFAALMVYVWIFMTMQTFVQASPYDEFTHLATTDAGTPCLFNCFEGRCRTGLSENLTPCTNSGAVAPIYRTIQLTSHEFCISKCDYFGESYQWCVVDLNNNWDYCSSETKTEVVKRALTEDGVPCKDICAKQGSTYNWCNTFDGSKEACYPGEYTFVQAYTAKGTKCLFKCERIGTEDKPTNIYNRCKNNVEYEEGCAPPALPVEMNIMKLCLQGTRFVGRKRNRPRRDGNGMCQNYDAERFADAVAANPSFITESLNEPGNPIYRYTVIPPAYQDRPTLPLVVRARITPATIRRTPREPIPSCAYTNLRRMGMNRDNPESNNDEAGHLVGSQFGGPNTIYNLAPQPRILNRGEGSVHREGYSPSLWYDRDENIRSFVERTGGSAELVIVVEYPDVTASYRPASYLVSEYLRYPNGTLAYQSVNYRYDNDPANRE